MADKREDPFARLLKKHNRRRLWPWLCLVALMAGALLLGIWWMGPAPPRKIRIATGNPSGSYAMFGEQYAATIRRKGPDVQVVHTAGSIENQHRLLAGEADIAFIQGGTYSPEGDPDRRLRAIAAVYLEPLWVLYRRELDVHEIYQFAGHSISIGSRDSGIEKVARSVLELNGIGPDEAELRNLSMKEAAGELQSGELDAAFFVCSYHTPVLQQLLREGEIEVFDFRRHLAYTRVLPYLTEVKLSEGLLDLRHNIPGSDKTTVAPSAILMCRSELHPSVVEQVLTAAQHVHRQGSRIDPPGVFPTLETVTMAVHPTAETFFATGESWISRKLPYWAQRLLFKAQLLLIPVLGVWLPVVKLMPLLYKYRVNALLRKHYAILQDVEKVINQASDSETLVEGVRALESMKSEVERYSRKIPSMYQRDVYHWRVHVSLIRQEAEEKLHKIGVQLPPDIASRKDRLPWTPKAG